MSDLDEAETPRLDPGIEAYKMQEIHVKAESYRSWKLVLFSLLGAVCIIIAIKLVSSLEYVNSDFFTFWLSGRLAAMGQNPYSSILWIGGHYQFGATWIPNATFIYPLPLSLLFAPLGLLSVYQAFVAWVVLSELMILLSMALLMRARPIPHTGSFIPPLLAGLVVFRSTILTLHNGQLSGLLLLVLSSIIYLWEKQKWWQGAVLLPLLALKPNLGVPIILLLALYLILQRRVGPLLLGVAVGAAILLLGWFQNPHWIQEFWSAGNTKLSQIFGIAPTIWGMTSYLCKYSWTCSIGYGTCVALLISTGCGWLVISKRKVLSPISIAGLAVSVTLLLTPTAWPYDQLLLVVPIIAVTLGLARAGYPFLVASLIFLAVDVLAWILLGVAARLQNEIWNVVMPLVGLGLLWLDLSVEQRLQRE